MKAAVYSCVAGFAVAAPSPDVLTKFDEFRTKWSRDYVGEEYVKRVKYFEDHLLRVEELQRQEQGTAIYTYLGPFADLSPEEMSQRFGLLQLPNMEGIPEAPLLNKTLGDSFDWVSRGAVNPVKDQGQCGSCWSFSTVCNLEGTGFVNTGKLVSLSEQNIMDCDKTCYSCNGGLPSLALSWSAANGGVASEASYPYKAHDESCKHRPKIAHNTGHHKISRNEDHIGQALVHYGPLSIAVDATPFQTYSGGVMNNPSCSKTRIDHAVNIVGYGVDGIQYWKIRNSWGAAWGEAGYIRVSRGHCTCALCTTVVTATGTTISEAKPSPSVASSATGVWDEIKVLVCQLLENGKNEQFAEHEICDRLKYADRIKGCDGIVEIVWGAVENNELHCSAAFAPVVKPSVSVSSGVTGVWDEIKVLVCQLMENGKNEQFAEHEICDRLKYADRIKGCDGIVEIVWGTVENNELHCSAASAPVVV